MSNSQSFTVAELISSPAQDQNEKADESEEKPIYSYNAMIVMALRQSENERLTLSGIYEYIERRFPYYKKAQMNWKNSIRHNLSLSKCFIKLPKDRENHQHRGSYWSLNPNFRKKLTKERGQIRLANDDSVEFFPSRSSSDSAESSSPSISSPGSSLKSPGQTPSTPVGLSNFPSVSYLTPSGFSTSLNYFPIQNVLPSTPSYDISPIYNYYYQQYLSYYSSVLVAPKSV